MSILKNRGRRKGKGPKPMHSKKKQKEFEGEEVKSDFLEAAGLKDQSTEDDITSILETQGKSVPKKGYIDQTSMSAAVKRWDSPNKLISPMRNTDKKATKLAQEKFRAEQSKKYGITEKDQKRSEKVKSEKVKLTDEQKATKKATKR